MKQSLESNQIPEDFYNEINPENRKELEARISQSLMGVMAIVYESGLTRKVNMGKVTELFGQAGSESVNKWIEFNSPGFQKDYESWKLNRKIIHFDEAQAETIGKTLH